MVAGACSVPDGPELAGVSVGSPVDSIRTSWPRAHRPGALAACSGGGCLGRADRGLQAQSSRRPGGGGGQAAAAALTVLAVVLQRPGTARLGLALLVTLAGFALPWQLSWWPVPGALGVATYLMVGILPAVGAITRREPRAPARWVGSLRRTEAFAIVALASTAACALLIFHELTPPGLQFAAQLLTGMPTWTVGLAGLGFVTINAAVEEIHRRASGRIWASQSARLPLWPRRRADDRCVRGHPGVLRMKSGGLLACWITHALADSVISLFILQASSGIV